MTTAAEYIATANRILNPRPGDRHKTRDERLREADVHAQLATATALDRTATALDRIATALETLAADVTNGVTLQPAIHHTV